MGGYFGLHALSLNKQSKSNCRADDPNACTSEGAATRDDAQSAATLSTVASIGGGALLATGLTLVFTAPSAAPTRGEHERAGPGIFTGSRTPAARCMVTRFHRLAVLGPFALVALSAACSQMLGIEDARIDQTLSGGSSSTNGGAGSFSDAGEPSSGGTSVVAGGHSGGALNQAGGGVAVASAGSNEMTAGAGGGDTPNNPAPASATARRCWRIALGSTNSTVRSINVSMSASTCQRVLPGTRT
ncbi:MAG: hypothetical protein WDO69_25650 [Pseudomonadota bacterium]